MRPHQRGKALAALWLTVRGVPELPGHPGTRVDVVGGVLCALGLAGPVFAQARADAPTRGAIALLAALLLAQAGWRTWRAQMRIRRPVMETAPKA